MGEKEQLVKWLQFAKNEIQCHADWWNEMPESYCKARARQALNMVSDLHLVIKEVQAPEIKDSDA